MSCVWWMGTWKTTEHCTLSCNHPDECRVRRVLEELPCKLTTDNTVQASQLHESGPGSLHLLKVVWASQHDFQKNETVIFHWIGWVFSQNTWKGDKKDVQVTKEWPNCRIKSTVYSFCIATAKQISTSSSSQQSLGVISNRHDIS
jgi:hypothetical protein